MRFIAEQRACSILRNLILAADPGGGPFLVPANVCPVVPLTFLTVKRALEFIDIDENDLCMDRRLVTARLSRQPSVAGILFVRTYGVERDLTETFVGWKRAAPGALIIDDRCLCRPECEPRDLQGADAALFSTGYGKYVDLGFGGFAYLAAGVDYARKPGAFVPEDSARLMQLYKSHIARGSVLRSAGGTDPLGRWIPSEPLAISDAEYLRRVRERLESIPAGKARVNDIYRHAIPSCLQLGPEFATWRFQIRVPGKRALLSRLFEAGHFASDHYYPASRLFADQLCPRAEDLYEDVVNLFNDRTTTPAQAAAVADLVRAHVGR